ncbi:leucyl aminopeptidase family protein [Parasphingopyxis sp. CP4]|nr:leucyl aminopeptidase family protein [Parasphingopyxis sp. CP4]
MRISALTITGWLIAAAVATAGLSSSAISQNLPMAQPASQQLRLVQFVEQLPADRGALVLPVANLEELPTSLRDLTTPERTAIQRALETSEFNFSSPGKLSLRGIGDWQQVVIVAVGEDGRAPDYERAGAIAGRALLSESATVTVIAGAMTGEAVSNFATGFGLGEYRSDLYRAREEGEGDRGAVTVVSGSALLAQSIYENRGRALIAAMNWTRDISNEPGNAVYPEVFVDRARTAFSGVEGIQIDVLDETAMNELGMGAILGVGRGSERPPRLLVVRYTGPGTEDDRPIVLAGKGITFDTGGISIKPRQNMENMRMDMSGAASVTGAVLSLALSRASVNVVAVSALAENMPDGRAIRPGDVLRALNGKTIQVISTDAEGRLVLADGLSWIERNLDAVAVVDVATLTGSVRGALSNDYAGLFSRHDWLATQLLEAGDAAGEPLWRLPIHDSYAQDMRSTVADIRNGSTGNGGGAGTAAYFLGEFISRDIPWAHLDIANMAWSGASDWKPDGSAGFGVRLLDRFVREFEQSMPNGR